METSQTESKDAANPYLALRAAKIARNEARLRELGLLSSFNGTQSHHYSGKDAKKGTSGKRKQRTRARALEIEPRRSTRRSRRQLDQKQETRPTKDDELMDSTEQVPIRKRSKFATDPSSTVAVISPASVESTTETAPSIRLVNVAKNSARAIVLDIDRVVDTYLGQSMESTGKAFVMDESARIAGLNLEGRVSVSFNKYSGVQEWGTMVPENANESTSSMYLWVNLQSTTFKLGCNEFMNEGQDITWFGGSKMHDETPVIQKLKQCAARAQKSKGASRIVLWCRQPTEKNGTFGPYVCMGRLSVSILRCDIPIETGLIRKAYQLRNLTTDCRLSTCAVDLLRSDVAATGIPLETRRL